jgi:hypothetical protein
MYFEQGLSKNTIAVRKHISKHFVFRWTQTPDQDFAQDGRGWPMGRRRKWDQQTEQRIRELYASLKADPKAFYFGATAIEQIWRRRFPKDVTPPLRTIGQILKDLGLSRPQRRGRTPGASSYLCYPEYTVYHQLGARVMEADFVGQKFLRGQTAPLHFAGFSFKKTPKLRYFKRIESKNTAALIHECQEVFDRFETPDCIKVDNAMETIGSRSGKRNISRLMGFLLSRRVCPIFAVPRRPFSQASIEGNNSVFARQFWNRRQFESLKDLDRQLQWFNEASLAYTGYERPRHQPRGRQAFVPKVYFLRQVHQAPQTDQGWIEILNEIVPLPAAYISYFVLAQWHLLEESLTVSIEQDRQLNPIVSIPFKINQTSRK